MPVLTRRRFLSGTTALAAPAILRSVPAFAASDGFTELRAAPTTAQLVPPEYGRTDVWAFGGSIPGPEIRVRAGERVRRRFVNGLPQTSAVHWHGIRLDNAMDGAAGLTQEPVQPGATFDYDFVAPDPGTYWYHSHDRSWEQMARGLSGPLIVEDAEPWMGLVGAATRELTLMLDDWFLRGDAKIDEGSFGALHEWAHAGRIGNTFTVNGTMDPVMPVRAGERLRLRFVNAANARIMPIRVGGNTDHRARLIALDGHPVSPRDASDGVLLTPAQRADLVIDCTARPGARVPLLVDRGRDEWIEVATLAYSDEPALPLAGDDVRALPDWAFKRSAERRGRDRLRRRQSRQVAYALPHARASGGGHAELVRGDVTGFLVPLAINIFPALEAIARLRPPRRRTVRRSSRWSRNARLQFKLTPARRSRMCSRQ